MTVQPLRIDIVSDVVCPWCIIGYKQVEKALTLLPEPVEAEFHWHPFELNPDMPPEGEDAGQHIARKYGRSPDEGKAVRERIKNTAAELGFIFGDMGARRLYNTFDAHKLLTRVGSEHGWQKQTELKLALFSAYFQQGKDVSDRAVLLDVAEGIGLDRAACEAWLADEILAREVRGEESYWINENVAGVPAIIFDDKYMVPGAQSAETFAQVIGKVLAKRVAN
ncbi:MAG: DsbA family oxidoreductase [Sphingomonadales bacterium]|jgi:predicted DsbA family dithiol-disulfide isomerase|nr:DsbA family oxidoreductase [Sphingomonadales bacterium]MBK9005149.1 DsbA family oxidoreductase [Sphingomonadales bacterium]MBK9267117.1 DsbA family oxidoreductase [Sphingomonadales bacterium]MBP6433078.1 DsbA family oxidoreductase [Sphingorhabdus sp.]